MKIKEIEKALNKKITKTSSRVNGKVMYKVEGLNGSYTKQGLEDLTNPSK